MVGMIGRLMGGVAVLAVGLMLCGCGSEEEQGIVLAKEGWLRPPGVTVEKSTEHPSSVRPRG